jgi:hypothetical protein
MVPIERGGRFGISGNGHSQLMLRETLRDAGDLTRLRVETAYWHKVSDVRFDYFYCAGCRCPI